MSSVYLAPTFGAGWQAFNAAGVVLSGGKLYTYVGGSVSTPLATYTDTTGATPCANPIILDSTGRPTTEIWLSNVTYKFVLTDANNNTIGTWDYVPGINSSISGQAEWTVSGFTPTYVSATQFTVSGNQTSIFQVNRRVLYKLSGGTNYGTVTAQTYDGVNTTTVTITPDSVNLDNTLYEVDYGFLNALNTSVPAVFVKSVQTVIYVATVGGTANAITLTPTPILLAYTKGVSYRFKSGGIANSGAVTVNVSGLGAINLQNQNVALIAGQLPPNITVDILYDGTNFQIVNALVGTGNLTLNSLVVSGTTTIGQTIINNTVTTNQINSFVNHAANMPTLASGNTWTGIAWNGTVYAAVASNSTNGGTTTIAATSSDGINWTQRAIPAGGYRGVAWNGSTFSAVGNSYLTAYAATSPDGITWTSQTPPSIFFNAYGNPIAWNGTVFVAVGGSSTGVMYSSPDGVTWTARGTTTGAGTYLAGVCWDGSYFCAVGTNNVASVSTSPDGVTWTQQSNAIGLQYGVVASNGAGTIVSGNAAAGNIQYSINHGVSWTGVAVAGLTTPTAIGWNGTYFCITDGTHTFISATGTSGWTQIPSSGVFYGMSWNGVNFTSLGGSTSSATSVGSFSINSLGDISGRTINPAAGTITTSPVNLTAGTNLTTPVAGAEEYDGTCFYASPVASNRGVMLTEHFVNNSTAQTGTNGLSSQPWFVTTLTSGQITLPAATTYEFEGMLVLSRSAGTTSHTTGILFGGTATITSIGFDTMVYTNNTSLATLSTPQNIWSSIATGTIITSANTSATECIVARLKGTVRINAAGTFIPQFVYSAAPGGAPTIGVGTFFRMRPLGANTVVSVGNWS